MSNGLKQYNPSEIRIQGAETMATRDVISPNETWAPLKASPRSEHGVDESARLASHVRVAGFDS